MTNEAKLAQDLTALLGDLIAIPSTYPPGDTRDICAYIRKRFERAGYACETPSRAEGVANVVARTGSGSTAISIRSMSASAAIG